MMNFETLYDADSFKTQIWDPFYTAVSEHGYKRLKYSLWHMIQVWCVKAKYDIVIYSDEICYHLQPSHDSKTTPAEMVIVVKDDDSFGTFLSDVLAQCNMPTKNYDNDTCLTYSTSSSSTNSIGLGTYSDHTDFDKRYNGIWHYDDVTINNTLTNTQWCTLEEHITQVVEQTMNNKKVEENKTMKFGNFDFGPVDTSVRMSLYGLAIKNASGTYVAYDVANKSVMDVDIVNFEGANKFMYKMPVAIKDVAVGDVVIHARKPVFVQEVLKDNRLRVMDIYDGEEKTIVLTKSPFNFDFATKIVNLINFGGANAETPFGNLLPLMLMNDSNTNDMLPFLLMNGNTDFASNPMLMYLMFSKGNNDMLPFLLMMNNSNK